MTDFKKARQNMVECQIHTGGVTDEKILDVFRTVPRELFLPENKRAIAYNDEDIELGDGCFLIEPLTHARMLQAIDPEPGHVVLNIGDQCGYASALFSPLVSTVITIEETAGLLDRARKVWDNLDLCNIATLEGPFTAGNTAHAPYDLVFMNGAVCDIPTDIFEQLTDGGRLVAVVENPDCPMGSIVLYERLRPEQYSKHVLFGAATHYIPGYDPSPEFAF